MQNLSTEKVAAGRLKVQELVWLHGYIVSLKPTRARRPYHSPTSPSSTTYISFPLPTLMCPHGYQPTLAQQFAAGLDVFCPTMVRPGSTTSRKESKARQECQTQLLLQLLGKPYEEQAAHVRYMCKGQGPADACPLQGVLDSVSPKGTRVVDCVGHLVVYLTILSL